MDKSIIEQCNDIDKREKRAKRKKKKDKESLPKPFKKILAIKNPDKVGAEKWTKNRAKNLANFPSPQRILLLGACGTGKSTLIKNLIINQRPMFEEVFLIHQDAKHTKEYDDLDPTDVLTDVPPIEYFNLDGKFKKRAVIIDDLELTSADVERKRNLAVLFRYGSTHKGLTIYFAHQSFFDVPTLVKKMGSVFIIWKPRALNEIGLIENRTGLQKGELAELFDKYATKHRDSICIDLSKDSPAKLRLNVFQPIHQSDSDDSDSSESSDSD